MNIFFYTQRCFPLSPVSTSFFLSIESIIEAGTSCGSWKEVTISKQIVLSPMKQHTVTGAARDTRHLIGDSSPQPRDYLER